MEGHARFKNRFITGTQTHGAFAPVGRIGQPDWIATAAVFFDAVFLQNAKEGQCYVFADVARFGGLKPGLKAFDQGTFSIKEPLVGIAKENRARQWRVVAAITSGNFKKCSGIARNGFFIPCQMRCTGIRTRWQKRHNGRIIAANPVHTGDAGTEDFRDQFVFLHARFDDFENTFVHVFNNAGGLTHIENFGFRFDGALPVYKGSCVGKRCIGQMGLKLQESFGGEIVIVHFDANSARSPSAICDHLGQIIHRMVCGRLYVVIRIGNDAIMGHIDRTLCPVSVLGTPKPDWIILNRNKHTLMDIK